MTYRQNRSTIDTSAWRLIRPFVAQRARFRCEDCGVYLGMSGQCDHIVPRSECEAQGIDPLDTRNLQWLCPSCHSRKSNREKLAGRTPKDRNEVRRSRVVGRGAFLQALQEGGA
ncbi:HNH endonuclease [Tateyamaria sp.]|uniref:HNH endonuclease n=1 Tax=Tateyamaria sp. TaxID=1929288 RepID=UPI003B21B44D